MEVIARDLRTFPPALIGAMHKLRRIDTANRDALTALKEKEEKLFEELAKTEKDRKENKDMPVDEEYFTNKMKEIVNERNSILAQMEDKVTYSKTLYEFLDAKIQYIDKHTANVRHLMQDEGDPLGGSDKQMKKKKKRKREDDMVAMNSLMFKSDPNEPVYCYCRQVSYGEMVGCDNPECPIEWFHFECVGLTETPDTKWYCPDCRPLFQK